MMIIRDDDDDDPNMKILIREATIQAGSEVPHDTLADYSCEQGLTKPFAYDDKINNVIIIKIIIKIIITIIMIIIMIRKGVQCKGGAWVPGLPLCIHKRNVIFLIIFFMIFSIILLMVSLIFFMIFSINLLMVFLIIFNDIFYDDDHDLASFNLQEKCEFCLFIFMMIFLIIFLMICLIIFNDLFMMMIMSLPLCIDKRNVIFIFFITFKSF